MIIKFPLKKGVKAMTIYPFIFIKKEEYRNDKILINHEKIHLKQQLEMLIIPFYLWYVIEYFFRLVEYKGLDYTSYINISFEREAYKNQKDLSYLDNRKFYAWTKYLKTKK